MARVCLSLGSNLGPRETYLRKALQALDKELGSLVKCSSFYETLPWGFSSDSLFLNAAACFDTLLSPEEVLAVTQQIEKSLGRKEKSRQGQYADRCIDIDILLYDDRVIETPDMILPHPHMAERMFVLEPLAEIMPHMLHPQLKKTILQLKEELAERSERRS
ncbi:MAG: 2-amino-4-hydroxy-6-hydroxymethyldihydropteridine diphosphokinase [Bacteroidaceae bacterium]|nr:2-amino-4-hydroxy-6-hydroxymethyldihydropteridine diphosphokinase [Bacteroidaceae bacterium]